MASDALAAWIGALVLVALSFTPSLIAPTSSMREFAAWLARVVSPAPVFGAVWTTAAWMGVVAPPAGLLLYALYPFLLVGVGLAGWGVGLGLGRLIESWTGWRPPTFITLLFAAAAIAWAVASR